MKSAVKYALLISLLSTTALADSKARIIPNNNYDQNKAPKSINPSQTKAAKKLSNYHVHHHPEHKSFLIREIQLNLIGITQQENFDFLYAEYLGKTLTKEMLLNIDAKLAKYFIEQDYLLPQIEMAEHSKKKGLLVINIRVASISNVIVMGDGENNELIKEYSKKILASKPARVKYVQKYLALMNKIPGYEVEYKLKQEADDKHNKQAPEVDLVLITKKSKGEVFVGTDNYGLTDLGKMQNSAIAQIYSPFGANDSILIHGSTTNHPNRLYDIGAGYSRIINSVGTSAHLFASHASNNPTKENAINTDDNTNNNVRAALNHHLYIAANQDLEAEVATNYKTATTYVADNNAARKDEINNYWSADAGLKYLFKDRFEGRNLVNLTFVQGMGGRFRNYTNSSNTPDQYFNLVKFNAYKDQPLVHDISIFANVSANYSGFTALPDQELFMLGGRDFGRGYDFGTIDGNKMLAGAIEIRYTKNIDNHPFIEHIQPYLFHDNGYVGKQYGDTSICHLSSSGGGLRLKMHYDIELGAEVAVPATKSYTVDGDGSQAKTKYGVFINKIMKF